MTSAIPKAELHCHIEGAAEPDLVRRLAARHGIGLDGLFDADGGYRWHDFQSFLAAYARVSSVFRTGEDFRDLALDHFTRIAAEGAIYGEIFVAPDIAGDNGLSFEAYVEGLGEGIEAAERATGIVGRMIVVGIRHLGPERVRATAAMAARTPHPLVTGFGHRPAPTPSPAPPIPDPPATRPPAVRATSPTPSASPARPGSASRPMPASSPARKASPRRSTISA